VTCRVHADRVIRTRQALLTGRNHHAVGMGGITAAGRSQLIQLGARSDALTLRP